MTKPRLLIYAVLAGAAVLLAFLYWKTGQNGKVAGPLSPPPAALSPLKMTTPAALVPPVAFTGLDGAVHSLAPYKGKVVLFNLWAPWCGPCVKELPALAALQKSLPADQFVVVPVDVSRDTATEAAAFLKSHNIGGLPVFVDSNGAVIRSLGVVGLPVTLLVGKDGREIARAEGAPDWANPEALAWLKAVVER